MEERRIDVQKTPFDFFAQGVSGYEQMIRHMQNYMSDLRLPPSYFVNIGTLMKKEDFEQLVFRSDSAFVFTDSLYPAVDTVRTLPAGLYMFIVSDEVENEADFAKMLKDEIGRQNMQVSGDYLCEVLSRFPFSDSGRLYFKIQVPVRRKQEL